MKILFFGTPDYVVPILSALHKKYNSGRVRELIGVVTQPPRPVGRDKHIVYSAADHFAFKHKIDIYRDLTNIPDFDLGVCASYGNIIPDSILGIPTHGILNIHPSALPSFRGASPIQATILSGVQETKISIIKMDSGLDTGPIISSMKAEVRPDDTNESLRSRLFEASANFLIELIPNYVSGKISLKEQDESKATITKVISRDDGFIAFNLLLKAILGEDPDETVKVPFIKNYETKPDATFIERLHRALTPWPGLWTEVVIGDKKKRLKILDLELNYGSLQLNEVQLEGKNPVSWMQFRQGYPQIFK